LPTGLGADSDLSQQMVRNREKVYFVFHQEFMPEQN